MGGILKNILEETRYIMKKYNIRANKSLGQNFLISNDVVESIVNASNITNKDLVIEIGPGLGTLTNEILQRAGKVIAIELDTQMLNILEDRFRLYKKLELINGDVLKVDLDGLIKINKIENKEIKNVKIVANLPYYITTPIVMKLLEEELDLETITVMIQREVANRLIAIPGSKETGAITHSVYYYAEAEAIMDVPNNSFIPKPEVVSKVIKLNIRKENKLNIEDKEKMFKIIKCAFMQKRKTLLNALTNTQIFKDKDQGIKILESLGIDVNSRAENLTIENFNEISKCL